MQEREGVVGHLLKIRQALGKPPEEEVSSVLTDFAPNFAHRSEPLTPEETQNNLGNLKLLKAKLEKKGLASSRAALCAVYISPIQDQFLTEAINWASKDMSLVRFYWDYAFGFDAVTAQIKEAADEEYSNTDEAATALSRKPRVSTGEEAGDYLSMRVEIIENARLLKKDPTALIDHIINKLRQSVKSIGTYMSVEYVIAGAELARDLYKQAYEIAAPLYPDKPTPN